MLLEFITLVSLTPVLAMAEASHMSIAATMDSSLYTANTPSMVSLVCVGCKTVCKENA